MAHFTRKHKKKSFTLGTSKDISALLWVAEQKGFLADHDVHMDLVNVSYAGKAVEMLIDGEIDSAIAVEPNIAYLGYATPKIPIKCLFSFEKRSADNILVARENVKPQELAGMTVGVMPRTTGHIFLMRFLEHHGIDKRAVKLKPLSPPAIPNALLRGEIDAAGVWHPYTHNTMIAMDELGMPYTHFSSHGLYRSEVVFATNKTFMAKHKPMIQNFIKAIRDAQNFLKNDKDTAYKILAQRMKITGKGYEHVLDHFHPELDKIGKDYIENIETLGQWIRENDTEHKGKDLPNYWDYIDNSLLLDVFTEKE